MTDDRVPQIFNKALTLDESKRAGYLEEACEGDVVLLTEVSSLLQHYTGIATKIDTRTVEIPGIYQAGSMIGPYKIQKRIGEGGQGIVYLAEQIKPVKRQVALKVIKPGMDTKAVIARFKAEQQALALMTHPGIAKVFNAGATPEGRPYFVMEYINGVPITTYCDRNKLDIRERIELLVKLCDAVQHAHQKAVIHRDLKPANILVTIDEGNDSQPKVIDFGIAKATNQPLTDLTFATEQGQFLGTPEFMSPEQSEGVVIDTRSDVYSLGVIIYKVLSGVLPFDFWTSGKPLQPAKVQWTICHVDPPNPSTKLDKLGKDEKHRIAEDRKTQFDTLKNTLRKELEWIPLMAIRKEIRARYSSAEALSDDLRRYLNGEPLLAAPESKTYRMRKLIRRNRGPFIAASLVALSLIAGLVTVSIQLVRITGLQEDLGHQKEETEVAEGELIEAIAVAEDSKKDKAIANQREALVTYKTNIAAAKTAIERKALSKAKNHLVDARGTWEDNSEIQNDEQMPFEWRYFNALAHEGGPYEEAMVPLESDATVKSIAFFNDGRYLASIGTDKRITIWDADTGKELRSHLNIGKAITAVASNREGQFVVFGSLDKTVRVWHSNNDKPDPSIDFDHAVTSVALSPGGTHVAVGTGVGHILILDIGEKKIDHTLKGHEAVVNSLAFSPDGTKLASSGRDGRVYIWEWKEEEGELLQADDPAGRQLAVAFNNDGELLATGGTDKIIRIWDVETYALRNTLNGHTSSVTSVAFSPNDANRLVSGGADTSIRIWDLKTQTEFDQLDAHQKSVDSVVFSPDGKRLASGSADKLIRIWDTELTSEWLGTLKEHEGAVNAIAISGDSARLATGSDDNTIRIWDRKTGENIRIIRPESTARGFTALAFNPVDPMQLAAGIDDDFLLYDLHDLSSEPLLLSPNKVSAIAFNSDGTLLAAVEAGEFIKIWKRKLRGRKWEQQSNRMNCAGEVESLAFRPGLEQLAYGQRDGKIFIWHIDSDESEPIELSANSTSSSNPIAFNHDGSLLAFCDSKKITLWDVEKRELHYELDYIGAEHSDDVITLAFSHDGTRLASGSKDKTIRLWDIEHILIWGDDEGRLSWELGQHTDFVNVVVFSDDGQFLVSGSTDKNIRIWETRRSVVVAKERREAKAAQP